MQKVDIVVYTKDRACQLNLLLRSIRDKFKSVGDVWVLYTYSEEKYRRGYELAKCCDYSLKIFWMQEMKFLEDVKRVINGMNTPCFLGLCDDDVFIRETDCSEILKRLDEPDVSSISLKAGLNIEGNYPNISVVKPTFLEAEPFLKWNWREAQKESDWGYPTCVNSYIFKRSYFLNLIEGNDFYHPPTLEGSLNVRRREFKNFMYSFREQKILNIPANRIQTISPNAFAETHSYTTDELNNQLLSGNRIATTNLYNSQCRMGNEERELIFEKQ